MSGAAIDINIPIRMSPLLVIYRIAYVINDDITTEMLVIAKVPQKRPRHTSLFAIVMRPYTFRANATLCGNLGAPASKFSVAVP